MIRDNRHKSHDCKNPIHDKHKPCDWCICKGCQADCQDFKPQTITIKEVKND